ncbi:MAG: hypothetical protein LBU42_10550 [Prevotellaceae bacterium]|nr:hypothetical protein [Prevotellaceae bacterium]
MVIPPHRHRPGRDGMCLFTWRTSGMQEAGLCVFSTHILPLTGHYLMENGE